MVGAIKCDVWLAVASVAGVVMMRNYSVLIMRTKTTPEDNNINDRTRLIYKDCFYAINSVVVKMVDMS